MVWGAMWVKALLFVPILHHELGNLKYKGAESPFEAEGG